MKSHKKKCQMWHRDWCDPGCTCGPGDKGLEYSPTERDVGVLADGELCESTTCPSRQKGQKGPAEREVLISLVSSNRTQGNAFKLYQ